MLKKIFDFIEQLYVLYYFITKGDRKKTAYRVIF